MSAVAVEASPVAMESNPRPWWVTVIMGFAALIIGAVLLWAPAKDKVDTYQVLVQLLGLWWILDGIMDFVHMFQDHKGWAWKLFMGIISIAAGGYILMYPIASALALPKIFVLVLGLWGIMNGIILLILGFKGAGLGAIILAIIELFFGIVLCVNYAQPGWGLSLLWTAAVFAVIGGIVAIVRGFMERTA